MKFIYGLIILLSFTPMPALASDWNDLKAIEAIPAKKITSSTPIFSQKIEHNLPAGWKPVHENTSAIDYILEFVPNGETVEKWNTMFTIQGSKGTANKLSPKDFLTLAANMHVNICGNKTVFELLEKQTISGFDAQSAVIGCGSIPKDHPSGMKKGMGEIAYYIAVKGTDDYYLFHKSMRGKEYDPKNPPLTKKNAEEFIADFMPLRLCKKESKPTECLQ